MRRPEVGLMPVPRWTRRWNFLFEPRCCSRLCWRLSLTVFFIGPLLALILYVALREQIGKTASIPLPNGMSYRSRNIRIPQYLLLSIDDNSRPVCKQILENIIPHVVQNNATDKDLVQSLFGNKFNSAYRTHSDSNERIPIVQGKLCSNMSNEWILFTILEKETLKKSTDKNAYIMEAVPDGSRKGYKCVSFDFEKCSVNDLQNDYPRLFQFNHEQHIKRTSTDQRTMPIEIVYIIYHYIRRKAVDYIEYRDKLTRINCASFNLTLVPDLITSQYIRIKVEITRNNVSFTNMDCVATLQTKDIHRIYSFQEINPTVYFDQLTALTNYNICASCQGINKICEQIMTLKTGSSSNFRSITFIYIGVSALIFVILFFIFFASFGPILHAFWNHPPTPLIENEDNQSTISNPTNINNIDAHDERTSVNISLRTPDGISVATSGGRSVEDLRGSVPSIDSLYRNA